MPNFDVSLEIPLGVRPALATNFLIQTTGGVHILTLYQARMPVVLTAEALAKVGTVPSECVGQFAIGDQHLKELLTILAKHIGKQEAAKNAEGSNPAEPVVEVVLKGKRKS